MSVCCSVCSGGPKSEIFEQNCSSCGGFFGKLPGVLVDIKAKIGEYQEQLSVESQFIPSRGFYFINRLGLNDDLFALKSGFREEFTKAFRQNPGENFSKIEVVVSICWPDADSQTDQALRVSGLSGRKVTRADVQALEDLQDYQDFARNDSGAQIRFTLKREPLYIQGKYLKFSRCLSQSRWILNNAKKTGSSVEEEIAQGFQPECDNSTLHAAGREDVDVRMLGPGRLFVMEFENCRRLNRNFSEVVKSFDHNPLVRITNLQWATKTDKSNLQVLAEAHDKVYGLKVWSEKPLVRHDLDRLETRLSNLEVDQKTPIRVLHRRSPLTRPKKVYSGQTFLIDPHNFYLRLKISSGAYVKEFVHGDFQRTRPNLSSLLGTVCDLKTLDVLNII